MRSFKISKSTTSYLISDFSRLPKVKFWSIYVLTFVITMFAINNEQIFCPIIERETQKLF